MKLFVAVAVICTFSVLQVVSSYGVLDKLTAEISRQKTTVQNTVNGVERHKRNFNSNLRNKLSDAKINSMQEINSIVNPTLKNIEDATKKSTAEGKDASHCYETARASLRECSMTGFSDLENCRADALSSVSQTQDSIDSAIGAGRQVISNLDSIFLSCLSSGGIQQMEFCVVGMMAQGTQLIRSFQTSSDTVINSSNSVAITAQTNAVNCNRGPVSKVRQGATEAQLNAVKCIAAL